MTAINSDIQPYRNSQITNYEFLMGGGRRDLPALTSSSPPQESISAPAIAFYEDCDCSPQAGADVLSPQPEGPLTLHGAVSAGEAGPRAGPVLQSRDQHRQGEGKGETPPFRI